MSEQPLNSPLTPCRVALYVDGFNLYFGMRAAGLRRFYWLDICQLAGSLLRPDQTLAVCRYFTSRISAPDMANQSAMAAALREKRERQSQYLDALALQAGLDIQFGQYLAKPGHCRACGVTWPSYEEKMTDVNIATAILTDAFQDRFDMALLVSADSDLTAPILAVRQLFPSKRVILAFPPRRNSVTLRRIASGFVHIEASHLSKSQLPDEITKPDGYVLRRPDKWK